MNFTTKFPGSSRATRILLVAWIIGAVGHPLRADNGEPKAFPAEHYSKMAAHSPFAPPTAPVAPPPPATPPPQPNFADRLTATSWMQRNGVFSVTVVDPDNQQHLYLRTDQPTKDSEIQLVGVKLNPKAKSEPPTITLRKGLVSGNVRYEPGPGGAAPVMGAPTGIQRPGGGIPGNLMNRPFTPPNLPGAPATANPQFGSVNGAANNLNRRPVIRGPQPPPAAGGRPVVLPGNATSVPSAVRPGVNSNDDDDDDE